MAAYGQWNSTIPEDVYHDISIYSQAASAEEFDEFDINGYATGCSFM